MDTIEIISRLSFRPLNAVYSLLQGLAVSYQKSIPYDVSLPLG